MPIGREQIDSAVDLQRETVPVPEWGGDALMQEFTPEGRAAFYTWGEPLRSGPDAGVDVKAILGYQARVVALSLINEDGSLVYPEWEEGVRSLGRRSPAVLSRLVDVTLRLSGLAPDAVEQTADALPNAEGGSTS